MRDSRDSKAMAQAARDFLADHGVKIIHSQSLAKTFGVADWNTLAVAISSEVIPPRTKAAALSATIDAGIKPQTLRFLPNLNSRMWFRSCGVAEKSDRLR